MLTGMQTGPTFEFAVLMPGGTVACVMERDGTCARHRWQSPRGSYDTAEGAGAKWDVHFVAASAIVHESVVVVVQKSTWST